VTGEGIAATERMVKMMCWPKCHIELSRDKDLEKFEITEDGKVLFRGGKSEFRELRL
jgi:hypothetical protein